MKFTNPISPTSKKCLPKQVSLTRGTVLNADNILKDDDSFARLTYNKNDAAPEIILDLGSASPGGYPVFRVAAYTGNPVLRIAYADWYDYILDEQHGRNGDFLRGTCKYLGVELPVLPANPNRFELYSIQRTGKFIFPLIQGQQRFVMLTLDTPDSSIDLESYYIQYSSDTTPLYGQFSSSYPALDHLWNASAYTVQIATLPSSHTWDIVDHRLAVRSLTKSNNCGIYAHGIHWSNYTFEFKGEISRNPHCRSGICWVVRAENQDSGYVFHLNSDSTLQRFIRKDGIDLEIIPRIQLDFKIKDNFIYNINTVVNNNCIQIYIDDKEAATLNDDRYPCGSVGFCQTTEKWAVIHDLSISEDKGLLWSDNFSKEDTLENYMFTKSQPFISDGAKRDRLPWLGDLYWAGRNAYYAYGAHSAMEPSIKMFADHQTPEGFIWGVCYPENKKTPDVYDYGYYESDIFSAWFIPVLYDYLLFTGDKTATQTFYPTMKADLNYLWNYVEDDGLFFQRYATSKGLWDHALGDYGKLSYTNILVADSFKKGAEIAKHLGLESDYLEFNNRYEHMRKGILTLLFDKEGSYFIESIDDPKMSYMACALALAMKFLPSKLADGVISSCLKAHENDFIMGKVLSLFVEGCFRYGYSDVGYQILTGSTGHVEYLGNCTVNWIDAVADEKGPACTTECMTYSKERTASHDAWSDMSHPDTSMAHIISAYILGILPKSPGYSEFIVKPATCGLSHANGVIPTPFGDISIKWEALNDKLFGTLTHPKETVAILELPQDSDFKISVF